MNKMPKLTLALLINAALLSTAYASEQSESKGFVEGEKTNILFRNGWIYRDRSAGRHDLSSWGQTINAQYDSGFTQGTVGLGVGAVGSFAFKIGDNKHSGNQMIAHYNDGTPYDQWARGGANVKARISNTTAIYGTQILDLPVMGSNESRLTPEYFTGTLVKSNEIDNLSLTYGHFTKDQYSDQVSTDGNRLKRADVWGAQYKFNDALNASYFGAQFKDALQRHYLNVNYKYPVANDASLTLDFAGYHTKYEKEVYGDLSFPTGEANTEKKNNIWATSATYNQGAHTGMLAYQQSTGNVGYDYNLAGDGGGTMTLPNSHLSDFNGNGEKSVQALYSLDFNTLGVPGLTWTTAYVYGWDINVQNVTDNGKEHEIYNQFKYTVQNGWAKNASFKVRNSTYRASDSYNGYLGNTNEWRLFIEYPLNF